MFHSITMSPIIKGLLFSIIAYSASLLGPFYMLCPLMPLMILNPPVYRRLTDIMISMWSTLVVMLMDKLGNIKVVITGDAVDCSEASLIIMNHRTRLDWLYFFTCMQRFGSPRALKVMLKKPLKYVPGAGWAMQIGQFIFVHRKWEIDRMVFDKILSYFIDIDYKPQILLFPEGTDFSEKTRESSNRFAAKNGLLPYDYVLHPRTTGFSFMIDKMRTGDMLDAVYDVTVGYPRNIPHGELDIVTGKFAKEVHFHIQRHDPHMLPTDQTQLAEWCMNRWQEKEQVLQQFYQDKQFNHPSPPVIDTEPIMQQTAIFWIITMTMALVTIYLLSVARWYCLLCILCHVIAEQKFSGFDLLQVNIYNRLFKRRN
ncbi:lysocardiolipin acyltransferase 1-like [Tubulanus polymorphus]|uniref:lysocardiolipin acyltransferase 1-like n=1 Tax=Tubulanus polymorphus TaxID=672921 RepID=UPI003DA5F069